MTTDQAVRPAQAPAPAATHRRPARLHAERASARLAARQIWFGALVISAATGLMLWLGTIAYHKAQTSGSSLMAALADNPAIRAVYGLPTAIGTLGGFTVWRVEIFVMLISTVWIVLATTRVLRGNEETGRLDLLLATPISLARSSGVVLAVVLIAGPVLTAVVTGVVLSALGAAAAGSWLYAAGLGLLLATFMSIAALAAQLVPERRRATGLAGGVLFATIVLRIYADGSAGAGWVRWTTPYGWVENLHAFGGNDLLPLIPLAAVPILALAAVLVMARVRDADAGMVRAADTKRARTWLLSRPLAFATRRRLAEVAAWGVGVAVLGVLSGGLAESLVGFPQSQPEATKLLNEVGMGAAVTPGGFIAIMDVLTAVVLAAYAITCLHADYDDEAAARLDLPYSAPVTRTRWAGSTVATTAAALVVLTTILALATWAGSALAGAGLTAGDSFAGAFNVLPVAVLFLGLAMLLHGVRPSWTAGLVGALAIGSYLIALIGPALKWPNWVLDLSPYYHLKLVPAASPAWTPLWVMLGIAVLGAALGLVGYARRDLV